jgi:very-short-patch-repair endonuclease
MIMIIFGNLASEIETVIVWCKAAKFDMRARHLRRTERTQQTLVWLLLLRSTLNRTKFEVAESGLSRKNRVA